MAKCERCGASFDYDERQGVCPRCCFYNRPPGAARQDTEWMKYYNVEDNSYQLPKSEGLADLFPEEKSGWTKRLHAAIGRKQPQEAADEIPLSGIGKQTGRKRPVGRRQRVAALRPGHTVTGKIPAGRLCLEKSLLLWLLSVF